MREAQVRAQLEQNYVSAVVYVSDDGAEGFLQMLRNVLDDNFEKSEIICVNDAGPAFNAFGATVINMGYRHGLESCMCAGVDLAIGDFVFEFDHTEVDYDPALIMEAYHKALTGFDIVACGSFDNRMFYKLYNANNKSKYPMRGETFRVTSRRAVNRIHSMSNHIPHRKALYYNSGLKMAFIDYKGNAQKRPIDNAIETLMIFTNLGQKAALGFSIVMMLATVASAIYIVVIYLTGSPVEGYTTMMLLMSFGFFMISAIMAFVIKYLSVIFRLVFNRQKYLVESVTRDE